MVIYITYQKATALAKKNEVPLPKKGEEFLIGKVGGKLGRKFDQYMGRDYYVKLYGDKSAYYAGKAEFNL